MDIILPPPDIYMLQYSSSCPAIHNPLSRCCRRENCNPTTDSSNAFSEIRAWILCPVFTDHNRTYRSSPAKMSMIIWKRDNTYSQDRSIWGDIKSEMEWDCIYMSRVLDNRCCECHLTLVLEITKIVHRKLELVKQGRNEVPSYDDHQPWVNDPPVVVNWWQTKDALSSDLSSDPSLL